MSQERRTIESEFGAVGGLKKSKYDDTIPNDVTKRIASRAVVVSAPNEGSRVISVVNEDDSDDQSSGTTDETDDDEGLSTLYEAEEEEVAEATYDVTADDVRSNFEYYSIDEVELDDVASVYEANSNRDVVTPTPSTIDQEETPVVEPIIAHAQQNSDDITREWVRRKVVRSKGKVRDKTPRSRDIESPSSTPRKGAARDNSIRDFIREKFDRAMNKPRISENSSKPRPDVTVETMYDSDVTDNDEVMSARSGTTSVWSGSSSISTPRPQHIVVVAVDFGTTYSGYAFSFVHREHIHMMRKWSGEDPGISNQKTPTTILLKPNGGFHSFGFEARDFYHDLDPQEARNWFYFERFKMALHSNLNLSKTTQLIAANGKTMAALQVFAHALRFFKKHALQELSDEVGTQMSPGDVRWVVTVPAIWRPQAKQFMREAAYQAGLASETNPGQLVIALEPEAASIYCRKLRSTQLQSSSQDDVMVQESLRSGCQYMVVDCGGGTVDVTVHMIIGMRTLQEVRAASGGAMGSVAVDKEFEKLLKKIFGSEFFETFRRKRPAGAVDLFIAWESRKRSASPLKQSSLNISLPFSFIELHRKLKQMDVSEAVKKFDNENVKWSSQMGMLRITPALMRKLFQPTLDSIVSHVVSQIDSRISHLFLVGGFAESPLLQQQLRNAVGDRVHVIIPNDVSLTILKGAVLFGLDPTTVRMRTSQMTYGVGILNAFDASIHPPEKRLVRDGNVWCTDIFDAYVIAGTMVGLGDVVQRSYAPVRRGQNTVVINLYSCERSDVKFIDEIGVRKCATLRVHLPVTSSRNEQSVTKSVKRELQISMMFGDTEIKVHCLDVVTGTKVNASIDFLTK